MSGDAEPAAAVPEGDAPGRETVAAVLLAAGGGSRFLADGHKLLAMVSGRPVAAWALDHVLAAGLAEVIVVTGAVDLADLAAEQAAASLRLVANPDWEQGIATSLGVGIDAARAAGRKTVVVGLADQPFVPAEAWRAVADRHAAPIAVATYHGRRGNPVRLSAQVWPLLPRTGDEGARTLMRLHPDLVEEVPCDGDPFDVDTVEDLARWN
jgi:molybdenum cofactor cytidylyltransferase